MNAALGRMPKDWRRALMMRHDDELPLSEIAKALDLPEPEVRKILARAQAYLRQRLIESGCTLRQNDAGA